MPSVATLSCPVCGAPISMGQDSCTYCGSLIFIKIDHPRINRENLNNSVIDEHIANFRENLRHDPEDATSRFGLGVAYFNLGLGEYAAEQLTTAAHLMPENSYIHSQLAVVLKELVRSGEPAYGKALSHAISNALKLNPRNVDALCLKAEQASSQGQFTSATQIAEVITRLDSDMGRATKEAILIVHIRNLSRDCDWSDLHPLLNELSASNPTQSVLLLQEHVNSFSDDFPLRLVDLHRHQQWDRLKFAVVPLILLFVCVLLWIWAIPIGAEGVGALIVAIFLVFLAPVGIYRLVKQLHHNRLAKSALIIDQGRVYSDPPDSAYLQRAAYAIDLYREGGMIDLNQIVEIDDMNQEDW